MRRSPIISGSCGEAFSETEARDRHTRGSFFVAFRRAKDAVAAAVECQRRLAKHDWPATPCCACGWAFTQENRPIPASATSVSAFTVLRASVRPGMAVRYSSRRPRGSCSETTRSRTSHCATWGSTSSRTSTHPSTSTSSSRPGCRRTSRLKTAAPAPFEGREGELAEAAAEQMAKSWRRPGRRVLIGATFAAAVVGVALGVALTLGGGSSAGAAVGANSVGVVDAGSGKVVSQIPVGTSPNAIAVGLDAVWVTTPTTTPSPASTVDEHKQQTIEVGRGR